MSRTCMHIAYKVWSSGITRSLVLAGHISLTLFRAGEQDKHGALAGHVPGQARPSLRHWCDPTPSYMWCKAYKWHTYHLAVQDLSLHLLPPLAAVTMPEHGIAGTIQRYKQVLGDDSQFCRQFARWTYKDLHWHTQLKRKMVTYNVAWYMLLLQKKVTWHSLIILAYSETITFMTEIVIRIVRNYACNLSETEGYSYYKRQNAV